MPPKFSIITCCWNSKPYIEQSIESVLKQTYHDYEYIFIDGGSTDGTLELIESIGRPVKLISGIKGGIANAMNVGIQEASGEIVAHMHSDDYFLNDRILETVATAFESDGNDWLFGRVLFDINGELQPESYTPPKFSYSNLLKRNFVPHAATFVKKTVWEQVGLFDDSYKLAMDYEMWLRIGSQYTPSELQIPISAFRVHPDSATEKNNLKSFNEDFKARFKYAPLYKYPEFILRYFVRRFKEVR